MIPVPQPGATVPSNVPPPPPSRKPLLVGAIVIGALLVLGAIALIAAVVVFGLNPLLVVLAGVVVLCFVASAVLRFVPQGLPGLGVLRSLLAFGGLAAAAAVVYVFVLPAIDGGGASWIPSAGMHAAAPPANAPVTVVFEVTGTAPVASVTYAPDDGGVGTSAPSTDLTIPFTKTVTVSASPSTFYTLSASVGNAPDDSTISCRITVDGVVIASEDDSGSFGLVLCSGQSG